MGMNRSGIIGRVHELVQIGHTLGRQRHRRNGHLGVMHAGAGEDGADRQLSIKDAGSESEDQSAPGAGELVQIQGRAVEEVQEPVVADRLLAQGAHDAGDAQQIFASGESRQAEAHPQEGPVRAQAGRNSHTRFQQWHQSMSGLLAGWLDIGISGLTIIPA